ncbi:PDGLE domain-containing protein [Mumia sp. Pv 4-285]|uniref:PDGLE domain-containing protein n=1 Tax=Mumia qirimensis TaxID=3234852 RepID=UPI00351D7D15
MTASTHRTRVSTRTFVIVMLALAAVTAGFVSYYASASPDGLEHVAGTQGFLGSATDHALASWPFADYAVAGIDDARLSGGLAGLVGCAVVLLLAMGIGRLLRRPAGS